MNDDQLEDIINLRSSISQYEANFYSAYILLVSCSVVFIYTTSKQDQLTLCCLEGQNLYNNYYMHMYSVM